MRECVDLCCSHPYCVSCIIPLIRINNYGVNIFPNIIVKTLIYKLVKQNEDMMKVCL